MLNEKQMAEALEHAVAAPPSSGILDALIRCRTAGVKLFDIVLAFIGHKGDPAGLVEALDKLSGYTPPPPPAPPITTQAAK